MRSILLHCLIGSAVSAAKVVYVRQDSSGKPLNLLPADLLKQCAKDCEQTPGCNGFSINDAQGCESLSSLYSSDTSVISFARTASSFGTCPVGSKLFTTVTYQPTTSNPIRPLPTSTAPLSTAIQTSSSSTVSKDITQTTSMNQSMSNESSVSSTTATIVIAQTLYSSSGGEAKTTTSNPQRTITGSIEMTTKLTESGAGSTTASSEITEAATEYQKTSTIDTELPETIMPTKSSSKPQATLLVMEPTTSTTSSTESGVTNTLSTSTTRASVKPSISTVTASEYASNSSTLATREIHEPATSTTQSISTTSPTTTTVSTKISEPITVSSTSVGITTATNSAITSSISPSDRTSLDSTSSPSTTTSDNRSSTTLSTTTEHEKETSAATSRRTSITNSETSTVSMNTSISTVTTAEYVVSTSSTLTPHESPELAISTTTEPETSTVTASSSSAEPTATTAASSTTSFTTEPTTTASSTTTTEQTTSSSTESTSLPISTSEWTTTSTTPSTTTTPNALSNFTFVNVPGSTVPCFYETRSKGRFSTNGLCPMAGADPCKEKGLVSVFGNCIGKKALSEVEMSRCVSTLSYSASTLCVPWEAMFADKANPMKDGDATSHRCPTGLWINNGCAANLLGVRMMTGRYTDNLLGFRASDAEGIMISTCYSTAPNIQASFCPVHPTYKADVPGSLCTHRGDNIGWTQTSGPACSAKDFYMNMGAAPCGKHSMLIKGSGGERCIGWDAWSTTTPFNSAYTTESHWFVWNGQGNTYSTVVGQALTYEEYMVLPRVLVTPEP